MSSFGTLGLNQVATVVICGPVCAFLSVCLDGVVLTLFLTSQYKFVLRALCFTQYIASLRIILYFLALFTVKFGIVPISYVIRCFCLSLHRIQYFDTWPCKFFHFVRLVFDSLPLFSLYVFNFVLRYPVSLIHVRFVFCHSPLPSHASCLICCPVCVRLLYSVYLPLRKLHLHTQKYPTGVLISP